MFMIHKSTCIENIYFVDIENAEITGKEERCFLNIPKLIHLTISTMDKKWEYK